jgi:uncharacterized protein (TIGR00730 family)
MGRVPGPSSLCVFCGAHPGADPAFVRAARATGEGLARRGIRVVTGGGRVGLMGAVADGALEAGGAVTGVIPQLLLEREIAHAGIGDLRTVGSMHERKALMTRLADGFVVLPGGIGTFDELFEAFTWSQLGLHDKPLGLLDVAGYFGPLVAMLDHAVQAGFLPARTRARLAVADELDALLASLAP